MESRSKKWNKFESWYLLLAGLPHKENAKHNNIHFIATSNTASPMEMCHPIANELLSLERIEAYDAHLGQHVLVVAPLLLVICDNPRASELCNHLGGAATKYCHFCMADKGTPGTVCEARTASRSLQQMLLINQQSTKQKKTLRMQYGLKEQHNPLILSNPDLFQCLPVEVLHTILLGPCKYLLKTIMPSLTHQNKQEILARLRSFSTSGLSGKMYGNVCDHYGSFVGRDYKAWSEVAPFIWSPYLSEGQKKVLKCYCKVFWIAYCCKFSQHCYDRWVKVCSDFVASIQEHMPQLAKKQKIHTLLHLADCMLNFGPSS